MAGILQTRHSAGVGWDICCCWCCVKDKYFCIYRHRSRIYKKAVLAVQILSLDLFLAGWRLDWECTTAAGLAGTVEDRSQCVVAVKGVVTLGSRTELLLVVGEAEVVVKRLVGMFPGLFV